jgi:predicted CopG family antitoxin
MPEVKKITITVPEDVARWLQDKAAETDRSVSSWIRELLERTRREEDEYETAMKRLLARKPRKIAWPGGRRPTREELYDRTGKKSA